MMSENPRVLLVDYDPKNVQSLTEIFRSAGYLVDTVSDGLAALAAFKELQPDIVLIEAMIPKKHGFEVCQEIKKTPRGKTTPVIIMTGVYKGRKYRTQAMHVHGCDEYVEKPCPPETLLELVMRFVPQPGKTLQSVGSRSEHTGTEHTTEEPPSERRGEVIPFPVVRSNRPQAPLFDEDAEMEIMSRLDEIMPDISRIGATVQTVQTVQTVEAPAAFHVSAPAVETEEPAEIHVVEEAEPEPAPAEAVPEKAAKRAGKAGKTGKGWSMVESAGVKDETSGASASEAEARIEVASTPVAATVAARVSVERAVSEPAHEVEIAATADDKEPFIPLVIDAEPTKSSSGGLVATVLVSLGILVATFLVWYFTR